MTIFNVINGIILTAGLNDDEFETFEDSDKENVLFNDIRKIKFLFLFQRLNLLFY